VVYRGYLLLILSVIVISAIYQSFESENLKAANAQEVIDTPVDVAIPTEAGAEPEQHADAIGKDTPIDTPPPEGGVVVIDPPKDVEPVTDWYDDIRLQVMSAQSLSYESTGEYTQITKQAEIVSGDSITFEAVKDDIFTGKEEVHVYEAPCGRGWQLIIYDEEYGYFTSSTTGKTELQPYAVVRSYGYGCEHDARTANW